MALPDERFIESPSLQNYFVDKDTGFPLAAGIVTFYRDSARTVLKPIYEQVRLANNTYDFVQLNNPIILSSVGTYSDPSGNDINIYTYPYTLTPEEDSGVIDLYYITVYSSDGILQFTREAWPPSINSGLNPIDTFEASDNLISNPQFVEVLFSPLAGHTYTVSGTATSPVAPGWEMITTGSGSFVVAQLDIAESGVTTNPPFALSITNTGVTSISLRQRFEESPRIVGDGFISAQLTARSLDGMAHLLSLDYVASNNYTENLVSAAVTANGQYTVLQNEFATEITTTNTAAGSTGYVDIILTIPAGAQIAVTSFQVVGVQNASSHIDFLQQTTARQIDHLFHYYNEPLQYKPIPSYLVGWDFPLNPAQRGETIGAQSVGANKSFYGWDQTILFQSVDNGITVARNTATGSMQLTANATTQMAVIQYLDSFQANKILYEAATNGVSSDIFVGCTVAQTMTLSLWWKASAVGTGMTTNDSLVTGLDANGYPTVTAGWTEITRAGNYGKSQFAAAAVALASYQMEHFADTGAFVTGVSFAIVLGTSSVTAGNVVRLGSISLVPGSIATRPAPQTADEVLRECQYYYEKSYEVGTPVGSIITTGQRYALNELGTRFVAGSANSVDAVYLQSFSIVYDQAKRVVPTLTFYSPASATPALVQGRVLRNGTDIVPVGAGALGSSPANYAATKWTLTGASTKGVVLICNDTSTQVYNSGLGAVGNDGDESMMLYHYECEARLGVV